MDLIYETETYAIRGACFEVYKEKGVGFLESVYQECLEIELENQNVPFHSQEKIALDYKGRALVSTFQPDSICYGKIIVEIKVVSTLADVHRGQVHNYLVATGHKVGLLVNFGHHPRIEVERIVR